ncbi:MAG: bifunctional DNA-formamidopyrimidine glycosylase/DNA-(apurinic or apyrimidinic site) lyase [Rhodospirillaceae bacterium]|jgi:formamidopyrimidine-DNA glycosylase|nr:bifunctional DNA-formamidopyrimidine glycosylase/DNA-(apurinic or apyrimidinic site) lyase [Rhodospirillaceae bacterium]MBT5240505.1 bifunctional DNA-formamidopyrimidine glycosylase/DNA-(apurinic or apyrimidinic site) lyase [Rhodospirillaceae bacterium]MBT5564930.1 bifunctional DNA-formamidopyrimidine glycosylase/DNA-(apurinic or apyrimidinic site) lyase [Rhodospirillaceae bacterium]MBT6090528.1 bifunctional DNA-formamidopyrimidine glycosylase/DNA-(apurinic or apyrimidinic site) lyase [Rhodos
MPELPEVETTCRGLATVLEGRRLTNVEVRRPNMRIPFPKGLADLLTGRTIERIARQAKYICMHLDDGQVALAHLGMSGRMTITQPETQPGKHDHVVFDTDDGTRVLFNDPRRFGLLTLTTEDDLSTHKLLARMGPDPLGNSFNAAVLSAALKGKGTSIKAALLDQRVVAGLGNIYVCEALFRAGISPRRKASTVSGKRADRLVPVIKDVLMEAIAAGGSTLRDYAQPSGELGYFKFSWNVYGREGKPCSCDSDGKKDILVKRIVQAGRSTFFCSRCQR